MLGIVTDFARALDVRADLVDLPATFFYPGSSIGNFSPPDAARFLSQIRAHCTVAGSGLLIGVDAKKDRQRLEAAYADPVGVTAAFNRNVLVHVNRLLGTNFRPERFAHRGLYNEPQGRIEMHLEALSAQDVRINGRMRKFVRGERIHTENSYKYTPAEFEAMLLAAGFSAIRLKQFSVFYAE